MNISNDTPALNYVEYFTKQLPVDLATMAALRDELAIRQGALSAAQDAVADRAKATSELATAREQAAALVASAKDKNDKAKIKTDELAARETELAGQVKAFETSSAERNAALTTRENTFDIRERQQRENEVRLSALEAKLTADQANLDVRVKDFQAKVAALTA